MKKQKALELLTKSKTLLQKKYGVTKLALFGSTARDTATEQSDIDILITFNGKADSKKYFGVLLCIKYHSDCCCSSFGGI